MFGVLAHSWSGACTRCCALGGQGQSLLICPQGSAASLPPSGGVTGLLPGSCSSPVGKGCGCCTFSQVFRKTWLSYVCRLFARGADVTSLLLKLASLAIVHGGSLQSLGGCEYLVGLRFQNMHRKQTFFGASAAAGSRVTGAPLPCISGSAAGRGWLPGWSQKHCRWGMEVGCPARGR